MSEQYIQLPSEIKCDNCKQLLTIDQVKAWILNKKHFNRYFAFCSRQCYFNFHKGSNHRSWKGGHYIIQNGYMHINIGPGKTKDEHIIIMEEHLGKPLPKGTCVHHIDGNKLNNKKGNLMLTSFKYHSWLGQEMARLYAQEHFGSG